MREMPRDKLAEDCSGTFLSLVVRLLLGKTRFCFDDICSYEFFTGLHRGHGLVPIPRRSKRGGADELCDVRAVAKDQASQRDLRFLIRKEKNMALSYNKILLALALVQAIALGSAPTRSWSQEKYPSRPIEMVVAFPAGGFADVTGRIFAEEMSKVLNTPIAPINKGGATGSLAATSMLSAAKDGYSILVNTLGGMVLAPVTLKDIKYDTNKDFYPVAFITSAPDGLTVRAESPYKNLNDLIDAAKKNPNKLSYGTAGTGVGGHFNSLILSQVTGIKIKHVPYKGGGEYIPALLGGHLDFVIGTAIATLPQESAGKLRTLALMGGNKMKGLPSVPTTAELGIKGDYLDSWAGAFVTAGTPKPVIDTLTAAAEKVIKSKEFGARIEKTGGVVQYIAPAEFRSMIERDKNTALEIAKKDWRRRQSEEKETQ